MQQNVTATYTIKAAKLIKFKDTKLDAVQYAQSGTRGKLLITFDKARGPIVRFHKIRGLKTIQQFDFATEQGIDYKFSEMVETTRIDLR